MTDVRLKYELSAFEAVEKICGLSQSRPQKLGGEIKRGKKPSKKRDSFQMRNNSHCLKLETNMSLMKKKAKRAVAEAIIKKAEKVGRDPEEQKFCIP